MNKQYWWLAFSLLLLGSCTSVKQLKYFGDLPDSNHIELPHMAQVERTVQDGDQLLITIGGEDADAADSYKDYAGLTRRNQSGGGESSGTLVAADGTIEFPRIGKITVSGLTAYQVKQKLTEALLPYLKGVFVTVKFSQLKFTVLGEVRSPGTFTLPLQRTTFLDALGAAGDLPITAKRYDIQVYRDYNGKRTIFKVDLRKKDILFDPELFQIRHNDVIYVQPRDSRRFSEETRFYASLVTFAIGLIAIFGKL